MDIWASLVVDEERDLFVVVDGAQHCRQLILTREGGDRVVSAMVLLDALLGGEEGVVPPRLVHLQLSQGGERHVLGASIKVISGAGHSLPRLAAALEERARLSEAMAHVGLTMEEQRSVFTLLAGIVQAQALR